MLGPLGAWLLVLVAVFVVGQLWFGLVESVLGRVKRLLAGRREPPAWHPLPPEEQEPQDKQP